AGTDDSDIAHGFHATSLYQTLPESAIFIPKTLSAVSHIYGIDKANPPILLCRQSDASGRKKRRRV
ncbi:MAG: hypothetical protein ACRERD_05920, partial [Candidatus Binatia bacterium]